MPFVASVADGRLSTPPAPGTATGVNGAAYTDDETDPGTATTLYDIDTDADQVEIQSPADAGTLAATGSLGVDFRGETGFDVCSTVRNGSAVDLMAYASNSGTPYRITLCNGKAVSRGSIDHGDVADIAIPLDQG